MTDKPNGLNPDYAADSYDDYLWGVVVWNGPSQEWEVVDSDHSLEHVKDWLTLWRKGNKKDTYKLVRIKESVSYHEVDEDKV